MFYTIDSDDSSVIQFTCRRTIKCPSLDCGRIQVMEYDHSSRTWFQVFGYCCTRMQHDDSKEWNALIDKALELELKS